MVVGASGRGVRWRGDRGGVFGGVVMTRTELAELVRSGRSRAVAKVFLKAWSEAPKGMQFVEFVRSLDESVPMERGRYKVHPFYMLCTYLRRLERGPVVRARKGSRALGVVVGKYEQVSRQGSREWERAFERRIAKRFLARAVSAVDRAAKRGCTVGDVGEAQRGELWRVVVAASHKSGRFES